MKLKSPLSHNVLIAAQNRIKYTFDNFENIVLSFSGGKDSTVMMHLVMDYAIQHNRKVKVMFIDFEAQYEHTAKHIERMCKMYESNIELFWICLPIKLRNAVSSFEPTWLCWDPERKEDWIRNPPDLDGVITDIDFFPFFIPGMEFEEFIVLFAEWISQTETAAVFIGIRADESLNRFRTIAIFDKETFNNKRWTTKVTDNSFNVYPIYDWRTKDIWIYHSKFKDKILNQIYELMHKAGVSIHQQRLCQPYGDDQRRGLWLFHILEPQTWYKIVNRVNGANSGALYVSESGNITGYGKISKPSGHTYKSFCNLLLSTMPKVSRDHYIDIFKRHLKGWFGRGYKTIPDQAPLELEKKYWAPSWRRLCKVLLRNDWWGKGLGLTQPKSEAYAKYLQLKKAKKLEA